MLEFDVLQYIGFSPKLQVIVKFCAVFGFLCIAYHAFLYTLLYRAKALALNEKTMAMKEFAYYGNAFTIHMHKTSSDDCFKFRLWYESYLDQATETWSFLDNPY